MYRDIRFPAFVGHARQGFLINFHERVFILIEDASAEAAVAGTGLRGFHKHRQAYHHSGIWRMCVLTLGYDHLNFLAVIRAIQLP